MIKNTRQLAIAQQKARALLESLRSLDDTVSRATYSQLIADLQREIYEFEEIRDGLISEFSIGSADDLGPAVIKARISSGLNQRQLAEILEVSEQAVQRDEAGEYERASIARLAEIIDALGHELVGVLRPIQERIPLVVKYENVPAFQGRVRAGPAVSARRNTADAGIRTFGPPVFVVPSVTYTTYPNESAANNFKVQAGAVT